MADEVRTEVEQIKQREDVQAALKQRRNWATR
jgi:hypothetical protein